MDYFVENTKKYQLNELQNFWLIKSDLRILLNSQKKKKEKRKKKKEKKFKDTTNFIE